MVQNLLERLLPPELCCEASIEANIVRVLNARKRTPPKDRRLLGSILDFGLGDVIVDGFVSKGLAALVADRIARFEPRLTDLVLELDENVSIPNVRLVAEARRTDGTGCVQLELRYTDNRWTCTMKGVNR